MPGEVWVDYKGRHEGGCASTERRGRHKRASGGKSRSGPGAREGMGEGVRGSPRVTGDPAGSGGAVLQGPAGITARLHAGGDAGP